MEVVDGSCLDMAVSKTGLENGGSLGRAMSKTTIRYCDDTLGLCLVWLIWICVDLGLGFVSRIWNFGIFFNSKFGSVSDTIFDLEKKNIFFID